MDVDKSVENSREETYATKVKNRKSVGIREEEARARARTGKVSKS